MTVTSSPSDTVPLFDMPILTRAVAHHQATAIADSIDRGFGHEASDLRQPPRFWPLNNAHKLENLIENYQKQFILLSKRPTPETRARSELNFINAATLVSVGKALLREGFALAKIRDFADQFNQDLVTMLIPKVVSYQQAMDRACAEQTQRVNASASDEKLKDILNLQAQLQDIVCRIAFHKGLPPVSNPEQLRADVLAKRVLVERPVLLVSPPRKKRGDFRLASLEPLRLAQAWLSNNEGRLTGDNAPSEAMQAARHRASQERGQHLLMLVSGRQYDQNTLFGRWAPVLSLPEDLTVLFDDTLVGTQALGDAVHGGTLIDEKHFAPIAQQVLGQEMRSAEDGTGLSVIEALIEQLQPGDLARGIYLVRMAIDSLVEQKKDAALVTVLANSQLPASAVMARTQGYILGKNKVFWAEHARSLAFSQVEPFRLKAHKVLAAMRQPKTERVAQLEAIIDQHLQRSATSLDQLLEANLKLLPAISQARLFELTQSQQFIDSSHKKLVPFMLGLCLKKINEMPSLTRQENDAALEALLWLREAASHLSLATCSGRERAGFSAQFTHAITQRLSLCSEAAANKEGLKLAKHWADLFSAQEARTIEKAVIQRLTQDSTTLSERLDRLYTLANTGSTNPQADTLASNSVRERAARRFINLAQVHRQYTRLHELFRHSCDDGSDENPLGEQGRAVFLQAMSHKSSLSSCHRWLASLPSASTSAIRSHLPSHLRHYSDKLEQQRRARQALADRLRALPGSVASGTVRVAEQTGQGLRATPRFAGRMAYMVGVQAPQMVVGAGVGAVGATVNAGIGAAAATGRLLSATPGVMYRVGVQGPMAIGSAATHAVVATGYLANETAGRIARTVHAIPQRLRQTTDQNPDALQRLQPENPRVEENALVNPDDLKALIARDPDLGQIFKRNAVATAVQRHREAVQVNHSEALHQAGLPNRYAAQCYAMALRQPSSTARNAVGEHLIAYLSALWADENFDCEHSSVFETLVVLGNQVGNEEEDFLEDIFLSTQPQHLKALAAFYERCPNRRIEHLHAKSLDQLLSIHEAVLASEGPQGRFLQRLSGMITSKLQSDGLTTFEMGAVVRFLNTQLADREKASTIALQLIRFAAKHHDLASLNGLLRLLDSRAADHSPVFHHLLQERNSLVEAQWVNLLSHSAYAINAGEVRWGRVGLALPQRTNEQQFLKDLKSLAEQVPGVLQDGQLSDRFRVALAGFLAGRYNDLTNLRRGGISHPMQGIERAILQVQAPLSEAIQQATALCQHNQSFSVNRGSALSAALFECAKAFTHLCTPKALFHAITRGNTIIAHSDQQFAVNCLKKTLHQAQWLATDLEHIATDPEHFDSDTRQVAGEALIHKLLATEPLGTPAAEARLLEIACEQSEFSQATQAMAFKNYAQGLAIGDLITLLESTQPHLGQLGHRPRSYGEASKKQDALTVTRHGVPYLIANQLFERLNPTDLIKCIEGALSIKSELDHLNRAYLLFLTLSGPDDHDAVRRGSAHQAELADSLSLIERLVKQKFARASQAERVLMLTEDGRGMHEKLNAIAGQVMS